MTRRMFDVYDPQPRVDAEPLPPFDWNDLFAFLGKCWLALWLLDVVGWLVTHQLAWLFGTR